jgi:hypothetical protein
MRDEYFRRGFFAHRGLIAFAAGGAAAEFVLLTILAPGARPLAPQATALTSIAAYHDLRWLFAGQQSALTFGVAAALLLVVRAGIDTVLLRLAWPRPGAETGFGPPLPALRTAFVSCAGLTALAWLLLAPAVTLTFGAAVLPFSWPFLVAFALVIGITAVLGHGGVTEAWWRRLPPPTAIFWVLISFVVLSLASVAVVHLAALGAVAVTATAGVVNARAWYGVAGAAARLPLPLPHQVTAHAPQWWMLWRLPGRLLWWIPVAPLAAVIVVAAAVGLGRLVFTGTIQLPQPGSVNEAAASAAGQQAPHPAVSHVAGAVLVVAGFGSTCCASGSQGTGNLRQTDPGLIVRQFSYAGMDAAGQPLSQGASADDVPLPVLGDRMAAQVLRMHAQTHLPVEVVAESEGTLGVYAMLARHPRLPLGALVLLSPIIAPGQYGAADSQPVPQDALAELNRLIGRMSPYGSAGAEQLLGSVAQYGAEYFTHLTGYRGIRWLAVVPIADATTVPDCTLPSTVLVVPDFHGGLLGDPEVQFTVGRFLAGLPVQRSVLQKSGRLRAAANAISGAAAAWRMPITRPVCP